MKLSEYVAEFLADKGITHVFVVTGGAAAHLIDSVARHENLSHVCMLHEQACAMAADGYSRVSGNFGVAMATSGPGATNLLTGVCSAYYDSVPALFITGNVSTSRQKGDLGVRQIGFQETDVVSMFEYVTNYSVQLKEPEKIRYELEKALYLAKEGRPGPVLIDIPDDLQRIEINPDELQGFICDHKKTSSHIINIDEQIDICVDLLEKAKRPVIILGWGIRLSGGSKEAKKLINAIGVPFAPTWAMADFVATKHELYVGTFGTHGTRPANFAVQNADFILSIGSRLDTKATGSPINSFAREARKVVVDIDQSELNKFREFNLEIDALINCDAKFFLQKLNFKVRDKINLNISAWLGQISSWKERFPVCLPEYKAQESVNPYVFVKTLSDKAKEGSTFIVDTGCCLAWMMQGFEYKNNQRMFHDWNNTAMGWALPASIGAAFSKRNIDIICVMGDGSLHMNLQELATVVKHNLPIKIFVLNNKGYSMIRQTQDQWLDSSYIASSVDGGLPDVDFCKVAGAYGLSVMTVMENSILKDKIEKVLKEKGPVFCNILIDHTHRVIPQVKFGRPNEDSEPLLTREEFFKNMIVPPLECD